MLFYSYFKTLVGKEVTVELKNDLAIVGTLHSVDQYLNIKLTNVRVVNEAKYPHMVSPAAKLQAAAGPVGNRIGRHAFFLSSCMLLGTAVLRD